MAPFCSYFGNCGGCSLQHIQYEITLENKKRFVLDQLRRNGFENIALQDIQIEYDKPYNYRNRMDFVFSSHGLGLRQKDRFDRTVKIDNCCISNQKINLLLNEVQTWFEQNREKLQPFNPRDKTGALKYAVIRCPEHSENESPHATISFAVNMDSQKAGDHISAIEEFAKTTTADNIVVARANSERDESTAEECFALKGEDHLEEIFLGKKIFYPSQGFFQNNTAVAEKMVLKSRSILEKENTKNAVLLDLYGGVGTFGISLSDLFKKIIILESVPASINCAKNNIFANNIKNAEAICADSGKMTKYVDSPASSKNSLFAITDPPRSGMEKNAIQSLLQLEPEIIIYISCNPAQFAKELKIFSKKYELKTITLFDMFPQTNHIESVAELIKRQRSN